MIYFKRELLNREENFNKRFGASPNVGVMQVVKPQQGQVGGVGSKVGMGSMGPAKAAAAKMKGSGKGKVRRMGGSAFPPLGPAQNSNMGVPQQRKPNKLMSSSSVGDGLGMMGMGGSNNNRRHSGSG